MTKGKLRITMAIVTIVGLVIGLFAIELWSKSVIYRPDAVTTVHNMTTDKNTQAYLIGKMQVYIDKTYRMEMPLFQLFVKSEGIYNDPNFNEIQPGESKLSLNKDDEFVDPNPFILRLKIRNLSDTPININCDNFKIHTFGDQLIRPNRAWQEVLAKAGFFAGALDKTMIEPDEEKILWLVYGTKTEDTTAGDTYQEYVHINYDSDIDMFATKIEFPFNFTSDTKIGNYNDETAYIYQSGIVGLLIWISLCIGVYYRKAKKIDEEEYEYEDDDDNDEDDDTK